jgi:hypothetical protein
MEYAVKMGSCANIRVPSFVEICAGFRELVRGYTGTGVMPILSSYFRVFKMRKLAPLPTFSFNLLHFVL